MGGRRNRGRNSVGRGWDNNVGPARVGGANAFHRAALLALAVCPKEVSRNIRGKDEADFLIVIAERVHGVVAATVGLHWVCGPPDLVGQS